jgi:glutamate-ammonia-ligase adenylyltransferase
MRPGGASKIPAYLGAGDWRGAPAGIDELPRLSHFAQRAIVVESGQSDPAAQLDFLKDLALSPWDHNRLTTALAEMLTSAPTLSPAAALRRLRRRVVLSLLARDASGVADLGEVVTTMTDLAEFAVQTMMADCADELARAHGVPTSEEGLPQDLLVVGMGKLGGAELNVSSDIDLIFVYDEDGTTRASPAYPAPSRLLTNHEFFERLGRRLIASLADVTADGWVFRVDMRLRPNGDSGPLALSCAMLEEYLLIQGREWERFAWLKARIVSAAVFSSPAQFAAQQSSLETLMRPFVFRKYLDFGAIAALRELHLMIRAETGRRHAGREAQADHVKLGRGGIREIEFLAQTFQIIRGGREATLRQKSTLATLATLAELGVMPATTCADLATAYVFLRDLEHALQYVDDAQTHQLPAEDGERARVARLLGAADAQAMLNELRAVQQLVAGVFDSVFVEPAQQAQELALPASWNGTADLETGLVEHLVSLGFVDASGTAQRLKSVLAARRVQAGSEAMRARIEQLLKRAIHAAAANAHAGGASSDIGPDELFGRFAQLADVIVGRSTYVALLNQFPQALERVMRVLAASRWATDYLARHPILLDELLDERLALIGDGIEPDWQAWRASVDLQLDQSDGDPERQMNVLRDSHHAQVFRLLVADLDGRLTVERLADHLSALADATLSLAVQRAWCTVPRRHREAPLFSVVAYGKLGGKELGYASDLDLIFLYDDPHPDAAEIYSALARRLVTWLSSLTSSGNLFEIDLRLRPDGNKGLLVSSFDAFSRYQRNEDGHGAWLWEHQALTRARACAGDAALGARFEQERAYVLTRPRDHATLVREVQAMRRRMLDGHPNPSALFDIKHDPGGMVDIEFIVQTLVLEHASRQPALVGNLGNIALLRISGELGLIDESLAGQVADAYRTYRRVQHRLRLNGEERARAEPAAFASQIEAVRALWRTVVGATELEAEADVHQADVGGSD